jgi:hypothetical protein
MFRKHIDNFKRIRLSNNSLVLCDIDNTIMKYPGVKFKDNNIQQWINDIKTTHPLITCDTFYDFSKDIKLKGSDIVLLTARNKSIEKLTHDHLNLLNITYDDILFCSGRNKGYSIFENLHIDFTNYNKIVFIDNELKNIDDMYYIFGKSIDYYHFDKYNFYIS